jgi:hypothetical protein
MAAAYGSRRVALFSQTMLNDQYLWCCLMLYTVTSTGHPMFACFEKVTILDPCLLPSALQARLLATTPP